jgi:hypothetical protein
MPPRAKQTVRGTSGTRTQGLKKKRKRSSTPSVSLASMKREMLKSADVKHCHQFGVAYDLHHNVDTSLSANLYADITQGAGVNQRLGDEIFIEAINIKLMLCPKKDRSKQTFRLFVTSSTKGGQGPSPFLPRTTGAVIDADNNKILQTFNTDIVRVLHDEIVQCNVHPGINGIPVQIADSYVEATIIAEVAKAYEEVMVYPGHTYATSVDSQCPCFYMDVRVPVNRKIQYTDGANVYGANYINIACVPYETMTATNLDDILDIQYSVDVLFKDVM